MVKTKYEGIAKKKNVSSLGEEKLEKYAPRLQYMWTDKSSSIVLTVIQENGSRFRYIVTHLSMLWPFLVQAIILRADQSIAIDCD